MKPLLFDTVLLFLLLLTFDGIKAGSQGLANRPRQKATPRQQLQSNSNYNKIALDPEMDPELVHLQEGPGEQVNKTAKGMHQLMKYIFAKYDKELMPSRPVYVKLDVLLLKVKSTIEKEGIFESVIALFIEWSDSRMVWSPAEYDNVSVLAFDSDKVWLPDIAMTNSADHLYGISRDTRFVVRVTNDGVFKFVPTGTSKTWCELNLLTFPFDVQTCSLEFESWSLDSSTMAFNESANVIVDHNFLSTQWTLCNNSAVVYNVFYEFSGETFSRVKFDFTVRRKSTFYMVNLVFPCATLSAIQLLAFIIPSTDCSSDRIGFGTTNLLSLVVFQTIVTSEMPKTSDAVTALSKYIIALIILSAVGILESVVAERLHGAAKNPPPHFMIKLARCFPLVWRSKSIPDYPNESFIEAALAHASANALSNAVSIATNGGMPILAETQVDRLGSTKFVVGTGGSLPMASLNRSASANQSHSFTLTQPPSRLNNATIQRRQSRFTVAKEQRAREEFVEAQYTELWGEIAVRMDILSFTICTLSCILVPLGLFLPLLYFGNDDCASQGLDAHRK